MPISGTQRAPTFARLGIARLGGARLRYFNPCIKILLNGDDVTGQVRQAGFSLSLSMGGDNDRLSLKLEGFDASDVLMGKYIEIYIGEVGDSFLLFGGNIQTADLSFESEVSDAVVFEIVAVGYHWVLSDILVLSSWGAITVPDLLTALRDGWAPSLELDLDPGLGSITLPEFTSTNDTLRDVFDRIAERAGADWRVTATSGGTRVLKMFLTPTETATEIRRPSTGIGVRSLRQKSDASRVATKVWFGGAGSQTLVQVPAWPIGTSFPIADATMFDDTAAGLLISDTEIGTINCTPYVVCGTSRFTYSAARKVANGTVTIATGGVGGVQPALSGTLSVAEMGIFPGTGWAKVRDKCFRYFAKSNPTGIGTLFTPNVYDFDSITIDVNDGDTVTPLSCLEGVIGQAELGLGDEVHVEWLITCTPDANTYPVNSAVGPAFMEMRDSDGHLGSQEALQQGIGTLIRYFNPVVTVSWVTEDVTMLPGREVTVNASTGAAANTYLIQSVSMTRPFAAPTSAIFPVRVVEASSVRETFAQLMRRLRG